MLTWLLALLVLLLVVAGMAIGVMAGRKPIAGSCGGIANLGIDKVCGICGNDFNKCASNTGQADTADSARDISAQKNSQPSPTNAQP